MHYPSGGKGWRGKGTNGGGNGNNSRGGQGGGLDDDRQRNSYNRDGNAADTNYIHRVDPRNLMNKWITQPYATSNGHCVDTGKEDQRPSRVYTRDAILKFLSPTSSEWCQRMGMALSLTAGSIEAGMECIKCLPEADPSDNYTLTGLGALKTFMLKNGSILAPALRYLNKRNTGVQRTREDTAYHIKQLMRAIGDRDGIHDRLKDLARALDAAGSEPRPAVPAPSRSASET